MLEVLAKVPRVDPRIVRELRKWLGRDPLLGASIYAPVQLQDAPRMRLRLLHPARDFTTYVRFADAANCCWNSSTADWKKTAWSVARHAKDPLSFCFHLERRGEADDWAARGFVMGGFARGPKGQRLLLLNGLYLQRRDPELRAEVLAVIEEHFARRFGCTHVAIAAKHGGQGPLGPGYEQERRVSVRRFHALRGPQVFLPR